MEISFENFKRHNPSSSVCGPEKGIRHGQHRSIAGKDNKNGIQQTV